MFQRKISICLAIFLFLNLLCCLCACASESEKIIVGMPYEELAAFREHWEEEKGALTVRVYKWDDNNYQVITLGDQWIVSGSVNFTSDRKSHNAQGIIPLAERDDWERFLGMTVKEVETELGEFHADIGSTFYTPCYILDDGYLVYFDSVMPDNNTNARSDKIVYWIRFIDLLKGSEIVKEYKDTSYLKS